MGILKSIKREKYINRLVKTYRYVYNCNDMEALINLRKHYSFEELERIYLTLKKEEEKGNYLTYLNDNNPFD